MVRRGMIPGSMISWSVEGSADRYPWGGSSRARFRHLRRDQQRMMRPRPVRVVGRVGFVGWVRVVGGRVAGRLIAGGFGAGGRRRGWGRVVPRFGGDLDIGRRGLAEREFEVVFLLLEARLLGLQFQQAWRSATGI